MKKLCTLLVLLLAVAMSAALAAQGVSCNSPQTCIFEDPSPGSCGAPGPAVQGFVQAQGCSSDLSWNFASAPGHPSLCEIQWGTATRLNWFGLSTGLPSRCSCALAVTLVPNCGGGAGTPPDCPPSGYGPIEQGVMLSASSTDGLPFPPVFVVEGGLSLVAQAEDREHAVKWSTLGGLAAYLAVRLGSSAPPSDLGGTWVILSGTGRWYAVDVEHYAATLAIHGERDSPTIRWYDPAAGRWRRSAKLVLEQLRQEGLQFETYYPK